MCLHLAVMLIAAKINELTLNKKERISHLKYAVNLISINNQQHVKYLIYSNSINNKKNKNILQLSDNSILKYKWAIFWYISKLIFIQICIKLVSVLIQKTCNWMTFSLLVKTQRILKKMLSEWVFWTELILIWKF